MLIFGVCMYVFMTVHILMRMCMPSRERSSYQMKDDIWLWL